MADKEILENRTLYGEQRIRNSYDGNILKIYRSQGQGRKAEKALRFDGFRLIQGDIH